MNSKNFAKYYAVITQGFVIILALIIGGYFLGKWIDSESVWPAVIAVIGAICGVIIFIRLILQLGGEKKNG